MPLWSKRKKRKSDEPLPMHANNVLLISSSAKQLYDLVELLTSKYKYVTNSEVIRLDNGDFAQVVLAPDN